MTCIGKIGETFLLAKLTYLIVDACCLPVSNVLHFPPCEGPNLELAVTGTARAVRLSVHPDTTLDFGSCDIGRMSTQTLMVCIVAILCAIVVFTHVQRSMFVA